MVWGFKHFQKPIRQSIDAIHEANKNGIDFEEEIYEIALFKAIKEKDSKVFYELLEPGSESSNFCLEKISRRKCIEAVSEIMAHHSEEYGSRLLDAIDESEIENKEGVYQYSKYLVDCINDSRELQK